MNALPWFLLLLAADPFGEEQIPPHQEQPLVRKITSFDKSATITAYEYYDVTRRLQIKPGDFLPCMQYPYYALFNCVPAPPRSATANGRQRYQESLRQQGNARDRWRVDVLEQRLNRSADPVREQSR